MELGLVTMPIHPPGPLLERILSPVEPAPRAAGRSAPQWEELTFLQPPWRPR
jgi:hypothetical protein